MIFSLCASFPLKVSCGDLRGDRGEVSFFAGLLRSAGQSHRVKEIHEIHDRVLSSRHSTNVFLANLVVQSYGRCGDMERARLAFDRIRRPNVFSWTIMLSAIAQNGTLDDARAWFEMMPKRDPVSWVVMIKRYAADGNLDQAQELFDRMPEKNVVAWTVMVTALAQKGEFDRAKELFDRMPERNPVSWGALISAYAAHNRLEEAKRLFDAMEKPNIHVYTVMITAYAKAGEIANAERMFALMPEKDLVAQTTMLQAFSHNGLVEKARKIFDVILDKDEMAWNAMITAYAQNGEAFRAKQVFDSMPATRRNIVTWNSMLSAFNLNGHPHRALELLKTMQLERIKPNEITFIAALGACADAGELETGRALHVEVIDRGLDRDQRIQVSLVSMYGKCRSLVDAVTVFDQTRASLRDAVCWTAMITAFGENHHCREAIQALAGMDLEGVQANHVTFVGLVNGVTSLGEAKLVHEEIIQASLHSQKLDTALVQMFTKCGSLPSAEAVFWQIPPLQRDVASYDAMVSAYAQAGESQAAIRTFELMLLEGGAAADEIVFVSVLSVCSHAGMLSRGLELFRSMQEDFGLRPSVDHFVCVVDLLGRSGQLQLAQELVDVMPFEPGPVPWTILLDSSNKVCDGSERQASVAAERTLQLEPEVSASYVLSSSSSMRKFSSS
ncbi:pentatricopeptide repeat-containing protein At1g09410, mitochondrial-like [Selaginella moellendorffii]|uniref:pentatricopeptide repeat-containing protein At1g09410, mitochondrial-like n=1 Tax=Selaginella moellendorffii TaxID=88036 RepID=UPI000D1C3D8F|nr:pentatricopeptide repeat-containing protein At1g09410, mitochondrial-like [Selaginella moellendorffii]|eukprot:XP_024540716.1 pentatricopeptide repeat-containing protein At1g09410, mitochondrial-like [Selaginella moellendorffii]